MPADMLCVCVCLCVAEAIGCKIILKKNIEKRKEKCKAGEYSWYSSKERSM